VTKKVFDDKNMKAANQNVFPKVNGDLVAKNLTNDELSRGTYLMERIKDWKTEEEK
jgi:hypothetical protein